MKLETLMRRYPTEAAARRWFESARWPEGPVCPRCGVMHRSSRLTTRPGQFTCLDCRHRQSVTSRMALHNTKLPLRTRLLALYLIVTSSKGISAMKLSEWLGVSYKTAWHVGHRIRAMLKRGIVGVFHYVSAKHLHRYAAETAFRWNERANEVLDKQAVLVRFSREPLGYGRLTS